MKILSCVPKQIVNDWEAKLLWMEKVLEEHKGIDVFVTPQEFFGGDYMMPSNPSFHEDDLLPLFLDWSKKYNVGLIVSLIEEDDEGRYERLWFIDKELKGKQTKLFEPSYTVKGAGSYGLSPETDFTNRFKTFNIKGAEFCGFFCWEVFSDILMAGLAVMEPDIIITAIKFGANAYPKNVKNKDGLKEIEKINYVSGRDIWHERLKMISEFEIKAPIIASTNSWNLRAKSKPMCGILYPYLDMDFPEITDEMLKLDVFSLDDIDIEKVRGLREHKFSYKKRTGEFPDWKMSVYTMIMKIHRMERKILSPSAKDNLAQTFATLYKKKQTKDRTKSGQKTILGG